MRVRSPLFSFNGGEISRRMEGRSDLDGIYDRAVAKMLNFVATVEGPAMKRPGFRYIAAASSTAAWLTRFVFNITQSYVLEWGDLSVRFYTNDGLITNLKVAVPYTAAQAPRISSHQSFDRLYLAHPNFPPAMLTRTGATSFTYEKIPFQDGPFKDLNTDKSKTITWSGSGLVGGIATVTATSAIFLPGHVGGGFMFEVEGFENIAAWEPNSKTTNNDSGSLIRVGVLVRSEGKVYQCVDIGASYFTGTIQPTHTSGAEWDGSRAAQMGQDDGKPSGVRWLYLYDRFGMGVIQSVSGDAATVKVTRAFPTTAATYKWAPSCFSNAEGWPQLVTIWGQRLIFIRGVEVVGSVVGDYFNFAPITTEGIYAPDMAFRRTLNVKDPPVWVHADKEYLLAGSYSEEIVIGQINRAAGLSSDNLMAQPQSSYGSAAVWPVNVGTAILFVQRGGRKIREADYTYERERFVGANINVYSRHITRSGVKWLAFQQEPEEMLWAGRADGVLIAHPHSPEQAIKGFSRIQLGDGVVISGVAIPSTDGTRDDLWILATNSRGHKAVLQLAQWWDEDPELTEAGRLAQLKSAFFVDWGVSYSGSPKAAFTSGLSHLEGQTVAILADGAVQARQAVKQGAITLSAPASVVHIGMPYTAAIKLLRPEMRGGPMVQGLRKRVVRLFARLIDTGVFRILDKRGDPDLLFDRPNSLKMNTPPPLFNGDTDNKATGGGSDFEDTPEFVSDDPLPAMLAMVIPSYDVEELKP